MASIPTSFMPHQASAASRQTNQAVVTVFTYGAYIVLGVAVVLAILVFSYGHLLSATKKSKDAALTEALNEIPVDTVQNFVRLHDRLLSGAALLNSHLALSGFLPVVEEVMPSTIRFTALRVSLDEKNNPIFTATGLAKSYNALAVASASFSKDARVKGPLFTGIVPNKDGSVSFRLAGGIDPTITTFSP